jgi:transporter family protein
VSTVHVRHAIAPWLVWALLSALFDIAILTKIGVEHINSDLATFIRTVVVIVVLG